VTTRWDDIKRRRPLSKEGQAEYRRTRLAVDVADQVRALRTALGITQDELARRMGTSQPVIARLEAGGGPPSLRTLERIADVLNAELSVRLTARAS
jgi:predicted transcriptional regulator